MWADKIVRTPIQNTAKNLISANRIILHKRQVISAVTTTIRGGWGSRGPARPEHANQGMMTGASACQSGFPYGKASACRQWAACSHYTTCHVGLLLHPESMCSGCQKTVFRYFEGTNSESNQDLRRMCNRRRAAITPHGTWVYFCILNLLNKLGFVNTGRKSGKKCECKPKTLLSIE